MATPKNTPPHSRPSSAGLIKNNDSAIGTDRSSDSLEMRSHDKAAPELDFSKIQFAQAAVAESTIKLANVLIEDITKKLGPDPSRPNIPGLLDMFEAAFNITGKQEPKKLEGYIPILKEMEQSISGSMDELLSAKFSFEKESHKSKNEFMRKIIQVGAEVANSKVNWEFAVNSYREAKENAAISYKNDLQKAYAHEASQVKARSTNLLANEIIIHQSNANYAVKISEAIERYVELMATANNNLSQAFSQLSQELSTHWNSMTTGRTALMLSNHQNSLELWKAIKATYDRLG